MSLHVWSTEKSTKHETNEGEPACFPIYNMNRDENENKHTNFNQCQRRMKKRIMQEQKCIQGRIHKVKQIVKTSVGEKKVRRGNH